MATLFLQNNCSKWVNRFEINTQKTVFVSEQNAALNSFCQKSTEMKSRKKYFFVFRFVGDVVSRNLNRGLRSNKATHYLLDYGNFNICR